MLLRPLKLLASANDRPSGLGREIETNEGLIRFDDRKGGIPIAVSFGKSLDFILEHI